MKTFVIAECCSSWRFGPIEQHLQNAYRMILAAKECGADAAKFQFCSDPVEMSKRRNDNNPANYEILVYPVEWLHKLKAKCDEVGIEFMCTVFLEKDIFRVAPLVSRFKVASAESSDQSFADAHLEYKKPIIVSYAFGVMPHEGLNIKPLHCVCSYPTPIEQFNLARIKPENGEEFSGISDHTTSVLTGALAVACGASVLEKHCRLWDTPKDNPDFGHSLVVEPASDEFSFAKYVSNIREAEKAMGSGENVIQECEKININRRVKV